MPKFTKKQWGIVIGCFLLLAINVGGFNSSTAVYINPILDELGFGRGEFVFYKTIFIVISAFLMPFYGMLIKKYGAKKVMLIASICQGLVFAMYGFATDLWHFYALAMLQGVFLNGVSFMSVGIVINNWFDGEKGVAGAMAFCGTGAGAAILVPILTQLVIAFNWRIVNVGVGVIGAMVAIPIVLLMISDHAPQQKTESSTSSNTVSTYGYTAKNAMKIPTFWMLAASIFILNVIGAGTMAHMVPALTDVGYTEVFATSVYSLLMFISIAGKIATGGVFDKFGSLVGVICLSICMIITPIVTLLAGVSSAFPFMLALFLGIGSSGASVPINILVTEYFGTKDFALIFSRINSFGAFGMAVSATVVGFIFDGTGSYNLAWIIMLVFAIILLFCLVGGYFYSRKHDPKEIEI